MLFVTIRSLVLAFVTLSKGVQKGQRLHILDMVLLILCIYSTVFRGKQMSKARKYSRKARNRVCIVTFECKINVKLR